jgi:sugar lactone lactonase YvrE
MTRAFTATVHASGIYFGEGPRWHDGRLWFSDFHAHGVFSSGVDGDIRREVDAGSTMTSGLGWLPDGRLLFVAMDEMEVRRVEADGTIVTHAVLGDLARFRANDMLVDAAGNAYVGNFGFDLDHELETRGVEWVIGEGPGTTLALVRPDGSVSLAAPDVRFPNGMALTADGRTLVVAETISMRLSAFDVAVDGTLSGRRVFADVPGVPCDGICMDADGHVWTANPFGTDLLCVADGGEVVATMTTSMPSYACALGGPDGRHLYALTAPTSNFAVASAAPAGCIEVCELT